LTNQELIEEVGGLLGVQVLPEDKLEIYASEFGKIYRLVSDNGDQNWKQQTFAE
jgi:hypothetical protein